MMIGTDAPDMNQLWAALLVEELARQGAGPFFLTPGSRCTPLTLAVARHEGAVCHTHFDERGMAFHALGHAQASGRPAVLVCTSGTAVANYLPAVVEASQGHVPLVLLTADRPPELLDCGANQAITQPGIFGAYTRWTTDLPCPDEAVSPRMLLTAAGHGVHRALGPPSGPVHLNCMFREPLSPGEDLRDFSDYLAPVQAWRDGDKPYTIRTPGLLPSKDDLDALAEVICGARAGLLVAGALRTKAERSAVGRLAKRLGWPAVPDILSGLRLGHPGAPPWLPHFDQMLLSPDLAKRMRPDVVLHVGGALVSKRLQGFLDQAGAEYLRLSGHPLRHDPGHLARRHVACDIAATCHELERAVHGTTGPPTKLIQIDKAVGAAVDTWLAQGDGLNEIYVARAVSTLLPPGGTLFLGNSMPVRDMDMFGTPRGEAVPVFANRGASGIDGNIATAAGIARASAGCTVAVMGDLTALHDLNSLALLPGLTSPFVLVVTNNGGGGIFSFLPVANQTDVFERHFATPHGWGFASMAKAFGIRYHAPPSRKSFEEALRAAMAEDGPTMIEVRTDREENAALHHAIQAKLSRLLSGASRT